MKKIIASVAVVFGISISGLAFAETPKLSGSMDYINGVLHMDGEISEADKTVTACMLTLGKTPAEAENSADIGACIVYGGEARSDKSGKFSFDIKFDEDLAEGEYVLYFGSELFEAAEKYPLYFSSPSDYISIINELNGAQSLEDFKVKLASGAEKIGFKEYLSLKDTDAAAGLVYDFAKNKVLSTSDSKKNSSVFASAICADALRSGDVLPDGWIDKIYLSDGSISDLYKKYAEKNMQFFMSHLNKDAGTVEKQEKNILDALILTVVKNPNGTDNIKSVFEKYATYLGAQTGKASMSDYVYMAGREYNSISECVSAFNSKVGENAGGGSGSSGGGSSSGGGKKNNGVFAGGTTNETTELGIRFNDLNSVPWAYKAISTLYEKGVISGKSEEKFCPNETVTREEFAKMLVCAAGIEVSESENVFSDAQSGEWYTKYINAAYTKKICSGISEGIFGVGQTVSREDMCVMVYNAMKNLSAECVEAEAEFADLESFGDYSKAAVGSLAKMGIVSGVGENLFNPKGSATRAQAAVIIYNLLLKIQ